MTDVPYNKRVKSYKMPYYVQMWSTVKKEWVTLSRYASYPNAIRKYFEWYEKEKELRPNVRKRVQLRLYDNLYDTVIADHDVMKEAAMLARDFSPKFIGLLAAAEKRIKH